MRITLINPPVRTWAPPNWVPLGLCYLAGALRREGAHVSILDLNATRPDEAETQRLVDEIDADWVGIGGIVTTYAHIKQLAGMVAKRGIPVVIGGAVTRGLEDLILNKTAANRVYTGEGELSYGFLWENDPPRTGAKDKHITNAYIHNLDGLPTPARDLIDMEAYIHNPIGANNANKWSTGKVTETVRNTNIMASRSCPYRCIYCAKDFGGAPYRHRSARNVIAEIEQLDRDYGITYVHFVDDEFMMDRRFVLDFCEAKVRSKVMHIHWGCTGRANLIDHAILCMMKAVGCQQVSLGIESGSQKMLDTMKKGVTVKQNADALITVRHIFDSTCFSMMIGLPGETEATIRESMEFCDRLCEKPEAVFFATPYPGTELYRMMREAGRIPDEEKYILSLGEQGRQIACNCSDIPDEKLWELKREWEGQ